MAVSVPLWQLNLTNLTSFLQIATAKPGPGSYLDFRTSDSWAAGTIAYEIFGGANPFYTSAFDGRFYKEDELPALPPSVPACVQRVVRGLLTRDPNKVNDSHFEQNLSKKKNLA